MESDGRLNKDGIISATEARNAIFSLIGRIEGAELNSAQRSKQSLHSCRVRSPVVYYAYR